MCTILLAYKFRPDYRLILASNRDEYYERPTLPAAFWKDVPKILAGRDQIRGGTWLGITKNGRVAALSNYRDPRSIKKGALSRGLLVSDFLDNLESPLSYIQRIAGKANQYNGFNLIVGDLNTFFYYSNRIGKSRTLDPGIYGLSNHLLDTPWPKVQRGKQALANILFKSGGISTDDIFNILADRSQAADQFLPDTGVGIEAERKLSSMFISGFPRKANSIYGTRTCTVLLIDNDENVTFIERTFTASSEIIGEAIYQFKIQTNRLFDDGLS